MCPESSPWSAMDAYVRDAPPTTTPVPPPWARHEIIDSQQAGGMVAAVFSHPAGWQPWSQVVWDIQQYNLPLRVFSRVVDPVAGGSIFLYPMEGFYWIQPNLGLTQTGSFNGGTCFLPQMSAADALTRWFIPRYRTQGVTGLRVVRTQPLDPQFLRLPDIPSAAGAIQEAVSVLVEYSTNGQVIEEDFCALRTVLPGVPTYGAGGVLVQHNWYLERVVSFCAPKGQLSPLQPIGWRVVQSMRINPRWDQLCTHVMQQIGQMLNQYLQAGYDQIAAAGQISRQITANSNAWLAQQQQSHDAANSADHRRRHAQHAHASYSSTDAFSDYLMGRSTYDDPYYSNGSQHEYHDQVWTDGQGNYQYRDNDGADPNVGSDRTWSLMHRREVGG